jgi:cholesterol transport system auxiliary component
MSVKRRSIVLLSALAVTLSGCGLSEKLAGPPPETYDLDAPKQFGRSTSSSRAQLLVPKPTALRNLDSDAIIARTDGAVISRIPDSQWGDTLPSVVQTKMIRGFENTGKIRAVGRPGEGMLSEYQLLLDIRAFDYVGETSEASVVISARIMNDRSGRIVSTSIFRASTLAGSDKPADVVAAFNTAFGEVSRKIVNWTLKKI